MGSNILKWVVTGYGLLLTMAAGGLIFANLFGFFAGAIRFATEGSPVPAMVRNWMHAGWVAGVCLALGGAIAARLKKSKKQAAPADERRPEPKQRWGASRGGRRLGFFASSALGACGGALLGGMLGGSFLLLWFSITYSPFAQADWVSSVSIERERVAGSARRTPVASTNHPVALLAFGAPLALGAVAGAVFGGASGVTVEK